MRLVTVETAAKKKLTKAEYNKLHKEFIALRLQLDEMSEEDFAGKKGAAIQRKADKLAKILDEADETASAGKELAATRKKRASGKKPVAKKAAPKKKGGKFVTAEKGDNGYTLLGTIEHPLTAKSVKPILTMLNMKKIEHKKRKIAGNVAVTLSADLTQGDVNKIVTAANNMLKTTEDMVAKATK